YKLSKNSSDWFCQMLKASDTGIIPSDELKRQRELMSENEYAQEFECSFDAAITGAVYGHQMYEAESDGRFKEGIYDLDHLVNTAWDLGYDDATAIWWWQKIGNEIRIIDYYETFGEDIDHYVDEIKLK